MTTGRRPRPRSRARCSARPTAEPADVGLNGCVPCAEPEGDPGGTGSPRGPPSGGRLWFGDEANREKEEAPRMAATIRDRKIQIKVNRHRVSHRIRGIKASLTVFSHKYVGRGSDQPDCQTLLQVCDARLTGDVRRTPSRATTTRTRQACERARTRTSLPRTGQHPTSRGPPSGAVAPCSAMYATTRVSGQKVRPRMAATIRGRKGKLIWFRQQY
jgi:hypothetical protein